LSDEDGYCEELDGFSGSELELQVWRIKQMGIFVHIFSRCKNTIKRRIKIGVFKMKR